MTIRLADIGRLGELAEFLRRCDCRVVQVAGDALEVNLARDASAAAARILARSGRCYRCGARIEAILSSLGSPACHDCRDAARRGGASAPTVEWSAQRVAACLAGWQALHPETGVEIL